MKIVNPYYLNDLLSPITGLADDDHAAIKYRYIKTEEHYRDVIKALFVGWFNGLSILHKSVLGLEDSRIY